METKWDFIYDEENFDVAGRNFTGVISNGKRCLFYHAFKNRESESIETCHIFSSITNLIEHDNEEVSYPWTAENDSKLLEFLNNAGDNYCGDDSNIRNIEFSSEEE